MNRVLALLTVGVFAGVAVADIPPPPPPKGKKYVSVANEVVLGKDVSGYVFVQWVNGFIGPGMLASNFEKLELSATKPTTMASGGRRTSVSLFAVPQDVAKAFKTDAELFEALKTNKVKGAHRLGFDDTATVPESVKGPSVKWTHTITGIDPKDGIKVKTEGEGYEPAKKEKQPKQPTSTGPMVAGAATMLALVLGGLWVVGRSRRKV